MNHKKSSEIAEEMVDKIISVAYGDASLWVKIKVMRFVSQNGEALNLLNSYKKVSAEVKQLGEEEFPHELCKSIELKTISAPKTNNRFIYDFLSIVLARPIVSAATSVILIAAIVTSLIINKPVQYNYNYSAVEITEAEKQAEYALSVVSKFLNETHSTLQREVLGKVVAEPFDKSLQIVNNLLEGDQNENN